MDEINHVIYIYIYIYIYTYCLVGREGPQYRPPQSPDRIHFEIFFLEYMVLFIDKNYRQ